MSTLNQRRKAAAMKRAQKEAVLLFLRQGFESVTVEDVAAAAEVSPASVYRYFGTKENLVLWDEFDPPIFEELAERLKTQPPMEAIQDGLVAVLDDVYDRERDLVLERVQLIDREPALGAASDQNVRAFRNALAEALANAAGGPQPTFDAQVLASATAGLLTAAVEHWQRGEGKVPLAQIIKRAFAVLEPGNTRATRT